MKLIRRKRLKKVLLILLGASLGIFLILIHLIINLIIFTQPQILKAQTSQKIEGLN